MYISFVDLPKIGKYFERCRIMPALKDKKSSNG
jgi:hypothetical protein